MSWIRLSSVLVCLSVGTSVHAQTQRWGTIGDSLTDEHAEEGYGAYSDNWTELLVQLRPVTFGPTASQAGVGWWGEPRRSGFEDNWARFGWTTTGAINDGQHTGLAAGVAGRGVTRAVMFIGANDFSPWAGAYDEIYWGVWSEADENAYVNAVIANYRTMLDVVVPTGVTLALCNVLDLSAMPYVQEEGGFADPGRRERVTRVMERFGAQVNDLARENRVVYVDALSFGRALFGENHTPRTTLAIGGVAINMRGRNTFSQPAHAWVGDGIHPFTVTNGLWANLFIHAHNMRGAGVTRLNEREIVEAAGMVYVGDTLPIELTDLERYVTDYTCQPDYNNDGSVDNTDVFDLVDDIASGMQSYPPNTPDFNRDGVSDVGDVLDLSDRVSGSVCP